MTNLTAFFALTLMTLSSAFAGPSAEEGSCSDVLDELARKEKISDHMVMPVVWMASPEYMASCHQAYNLAKYNLQNALRRKNTSGKKLAVVLDLDETVLDNSPHQAYKAMTALENSQASWYEWVKQANAKAIPGAKEFLDYADSKGVELIYISNRALDAFKPTLSNLNKLDIPVKTENLLLRNRATGTSSKEDRRLAVLAKDYEVVLYIGDNLGDFHSIFEGASNEARLEAVNQMRDEFGKKFIFLSNPSYGDWENSLYNYSRKLTPKEQKEILEGQLRPYSEQSTEHK